MIRLLCLFLISLQAYTAVDPPNYDFSLDSLKPFFPGSTLAAIESAHGKGEIMNKNGKTITYVYYIKQIRYRFPVMVQIFEKKVLDFYTRLPGYFSHDLFHQGLINRFGKQDGYTNNNNHSVYVWKNKKNMQITYGGGCTIKCFPMYLTAQIIKKPLALIDYLSLLDKFTDEDNELFKTSK